jgi:DNA-binding protein Fis
VGKVLVTNNDIVALARGKEYDKVAFIVISKKDYGDVLKEHEAFIEACRKNSISLEVELVRLDELGEKPFRSVFSTLLKYYREHDELHVFVASSEVPVSSVLLVLATLALPLSDEKRVKLTAEYIDFRVELNVNEYVKFIKLDEVEKKIVWYLQVWGDAKLSEVATALGKSRTTIYKKLKKLEEISLVKTTETYTYRSEKFINVYSTI